MTDPRLLGTLERVAHALEEHVRLLRQVLLRLGWLAGEQGEKERP